jgi:hypothetical protein
VKKTILSTCIFLGLSATAAADFDGSKPLLCSTVTVNECVPGGSCEQVRNVEIGAPDFIRIDVRKKTMSGTAKGAERPANKIDSSAVLGNSLFLQGKASGLEHLPEDSLAWSISVDQATGEMVLTASGNEVAFVIFGSCMAP